MLVTLDADHENVLLQIYVGTRTRDGSVGPGQADPGLLILATKARVTPALIVEGMREVLHRQGGAAVFKRIRVTYGPPVDYTE